LKEAIGKKNSEQLQKHFQHEKTIFWNKGFDILQNINDRMTLEKELKQAKNPIFLITKSKKPDDTNYEQEKLPTKNKEKDILQLGLKSR
jgi:hypothetical protein